MSADDVKIAVKKNKRSASGEEVGRLFAIIGEVNYEKMEE